MANISIKSHSILSKIGISLYKTRKSLDQSLTAEIFLQKRDDILAVLPDTLENHSNEEIALFIGIMNTMTSEEPLINETKIAANSNRDLDIELLNFDEYKSVKNIISFGVTINSKINLIKAPLINEILRKPDLKKPLWEKIKNRAH
ncbi:MAG: hypothetical protein ACJ0F7_02760 [Gammaproteobacteria bacterium]|uniref:Uncharacterized protein n=1 Tax=SAR86 cluster bacterium TaxID=2030880 RepID=A0A368C8A3_9GAMM|nr:MAG: hypothetical protein DBW92_00020 [SAR86 cluster bacterium]|tara:strand:- start:159 stop:596 length:438 start_codon:yes stop_codon:yes gene_type:complete